MSITPTATVNQACPVPVQTFADVAARLLQPGNTSASSGGGGGRPQQVVAVTGGVRGRSRSPQVKRGPDGNAEEDVNGYRRQGRPRNLNRPATAGASKVVVEEFGALQHSLQYYIGNTPGKANEEVIRKVLERCAAPLLDEERGPLVIESVHCLTKETDPRTKCWRVVVPPRYKDIMENSELYPEGWRFREFVGIFRNSSRTAKKVRTDETNVVDQVLAETDQQASNQNVQLLQSLQQQVMQLVQLQGGGLAEQDSCEPAKPAQG